MNATFSVQQLLESNSSVKICAPMVRYSKLPFRLLVREYGCDLAVTPMIVADAFINSVQARDNELTICDGDRPLIVQFAARNATELANATELVALHCDGVDLNGGCPQRWAINEGFGSYLLNHPQIVKDMVLQTKNRINKHEEFPLSLKIRIHDEVGKTIDLCRQAEKAGISWLTVHGRTPEQRNEPVQLDAIKLIKENLSIPVIANGDIKTLDDVQHVTTLTGVQGVMVARGLLQNPAMFAGYTPTPHECIGRWLWLALSTGTPLTYLQHHLIYMTSKLMPSTERKKLTLINSVSGILDFFSENYNIYPIEKRTNL